MPRKGSKHSEEAKRKIGLTQKNRFFSEEHRRRLSEARKAFVGKDAPCWRGGIATLPYPTDWTDDLREAIRKRDGYICQLCGIYQDELNGRFKKFDVHYKDYDKNNLNPDNLIALCRSCHGKTNFHKDYWGQFFEVDGKEYEEEKQCNIPG